MTAAAHDDAVALGRRLGVALSGDELHRIAAHLGRVPTPTELFAFDAQWSEHCSYKSSREHLKKLPTDGPSVLLGVGEDAGIVRLGEWQGETYGIVVAHESHNHPSQVVPFEGAATGIGGIVRDVLCMGAEVIGVADPLRFGRLENEHCRYVAQQVVDGIAAYGNAIGVPNVGGDVFFDDSFDDNVLVNVVALGLVKEKEIIHSRAPENSVGWDIVLVGKATDRSGFGGASFSSLTLDEDDAEQNKGAVQVPDPFLKNVIMRASYAVFAALREQKIVAGFKDLGAGGLAGCSAELCAAGGKGAEVELERVATAQRDLPPEVIAIGETQERLCWIVPPAFTPTLLAIYNEMYALPRVARGACAAVIGKVTDTRRYVARLHGETVMDVDLEFLTGGIRYSRPFTIAPPPVDDAAERDRELRDVAAAGHPTLGALLRDVLAHRDVCSRATIVWRYDGVVRGATSIPPGYADAGVLVPVAGAPLGAATAIGGNPRYGKIDARRAAQLAVVEAIGRVSAVGAIPAGLTDCLNFGDPTVPEQMGAFVAAVDGLADAARAFDVPFVSGNVSLYNRSSSGNHVAPSPIVACIGTLADVAVSATRGFKVPGAAIVVTAPLQDALGGSVIAERLALRTRALPRIDERRFAAECALVRAALERRVVASAHLVGDGGLLTAIAKMALASERGCGFRVDPKPLAEPLGHEVLWFAQTPAFVLEVVDADGFARLTAEMRVAAYDAGEVLADPVAAIGDERIAMAELREAWEAPLRDFYGAAA
ncbi:phosphoribosylformylglycinamidine synthase subunit PurL [Vulcanimicrobium alpinum]|uniref:Phosphoribosylformylglycinamidine synthase subunit PurL n=1 Tax=Vulcanimicrobium alpinum TaxID=3016050 RepID=A0AAN2C8X9_UNVUL|nr:phosphoribosylformylglycinamidine synthase subunit PurL [Vulcanimicrobium alpinum]BDE05955.1 phosphoribosylformylglycinamidine synthase subunit PurL [Vulcanimicrobium alpinum]